MRKFISFHSLIQEIFTEHLLCTQTQGHVPGTRGSRVNRLDEGACSKKLLGGKQKKKKKTEKSSMTENDRKRGRATLNWVTMSNGTRNGNSLYYSLYSTHFKFLKQAIDRIISEGCTKMTFELRFEN